MSNTNSLVRDANSEVIPQQYYDETTAQYKVVANGDTTGVDFSKKTLLRDANFEIIPAQYYDVNVGKFVLGMLSGNSNSGGTTVNVPNASTSQSGKVQLSNEVNSDSQNMASTPLAVKNALTEAKEYADNAVQEVNDKILYTKPTKSFIVCVAGQSNAVGYDESPVSDIVSKNLSPSRIRQLGIYDDENLQIIELGHHAHSLQDMRSKYNTASPTKLGTKGVHLPLGNLLLNEIPEDYRIVFVSVAYGSTGFNSGNAGDYNDVDLKPNNPGAGLKWGVDTAYYKTMRDRIKFMLDENEENIFGGVVWIQGEKDNGNATAHKNNFEAMTTEFFRYFNEEEGGKYKKRAYKGTWDRDLWYNVESTAYWFRQGQGKTLFANYKTWNPNTYVAIPRDTDTNKINGMYPDEPNTSSTPETHFGNDAYTKVIAPLIVKKMKENGGLFNKQAKSSLSDINEGFDITLDASEKALADGDFAGVGSASTVTLGSDKKLTFTPTVAAYNSNINMNGAYKVTFEATQKFYWLAFRGSLSEKFAIMGIGGEYSGKISEATVSPASTRQMKVSLEGGSAYDLQAGDKVSVYLNADGVIEVYLKKSAEDQFNFWFKCDTSERDDVYTCSADRLTGFAFGVSQTAVLSPYTAKDAMKNVTIQKNKGHVNNAALDALIYNKAVEVAKELTATYATQISELTARVEQLENPQTQSTD